MFKKLILICVINGGRNGVKCIIVVILLRLL